MTDEKHNSGIDWKNKLEELNTISGAVFNKDAAWTRLHTRLEKKDSNRKFVWYWIAAASLLLMFIIPFTQSKKKEGITVNTKLIQESKETLIPSKVIEPKTNYVENIISSSIENQTKNSTETNKREKNISPKLNVAVNKNQLPITVSYVDTPIQQVKIAMQIEDTTSNIASTVVLQKKLKVVHINELGEPEEISPDVARNLIIHYFHFKLAGEEVYINHPEKSTISGFGILKSKNSPN